MLRRRSAGVPLQKDYRRYKPHLRVDFEHSCCYCDLHENENAGPRHFHVEHYRPKGVARFAHLISDYRNLLYACDVCNGFKGNHWPSDNPLDTGRGFLDPCEHDLEDHIQVGEDHAVRGLTPVGSFMVEALHLNRQQLRRVRLNRQQAQDAAESNRVRAQELVDSITTKIESLGADSDAELRAALECALEIARIELQTARKGWRARFVTEWDEGDYR